MKQIKVNKKIVMSLMEKEKLTIPSLARKMGIDRTYLYRVLNGKQEIGRKFIEGILSAFPNKSINDIIFFENCGDKKITGYQETVNIKQGEMTCQNQDGKTS